MPIIVLFLSAGVLFDGASSLWVSWSICYGLFLTTSLKKYYHRNCLVESRATSVNPSRYENEERVPVKSCIRVALVGLIVLGVTVCL